ncbi:MAG: 3'-5' exoribonuclease YhaM family protein [Planctomycetota bacterium]
MTDLRQKRVELRRLPPGSELIDEVFRVRRAAIRDSRNGSRYLTLVLEDAAGPLDARLFDANDSDLAAFADGSVVQVSGTLEVWQQRPQLVVRQFGPPERAVGDEEITAPAPPPVNLPARLADLRELLATLRDPWLARLRDACLADSDFMARFAEWPAASRYHHPWRHGLLDHTLAAMQLAASICTHYPAVNRDLVLIGVWLHDSGKVDELEPGPGDAAHWQYSRPGKLLGHITQGLLRLERLLAGLPDFPPVLADELRHIVLSHHGDAERGSPRSPMTREAVIVHHVECLDSELATFDQEESQATPTLDGSPVFAWSRRFRRDLMVRPPAPGGASANNSGDAPHGR